MSHDGALFAMSTIALFPTPDCSGQGFLPLDSQPAPLLRSLFYPGGSTAYYAGNPAAVQTFASMASLDGVGGCVATQGQWADPVFAGPLNTIDMLAFPGPFRVQ